MIRRNLTVRFLLAYVLITVCMKALSGSAWILLQGLSALRYGASLSLGGILQEFLAYVGQSLTALLLPGTDVGSLAGALVSAGILVAGAAMFANGPAKQFRGLCEKAGMLAADATVPGIGENGDSEMERKLDAIAARMTDAQNALQAHRADCEEAALLLDAARTQIEVIVEAGTLAQGSAETALILDALTKIKRAASQLIG